MNRFGLDLGTKHIVLSMKDKSGKLITRYEVNGYLIMPKSDNFTKNLLIKQGVPFVERGNELIAIGSKAEKLAYSFNRPLKRPMAEGAVSRDDDDAQEIIAIIIRSIIGKLNDDTILYYCTTAKAVNDANLNVEFHKKVVKLIVEGYTDEAKVEAHHINEARCLILEEAGEAVGISWGAGTVTVCAASFGIPIFEFCVVGSGDLVDLEAAKRFGFDPEHPGKESLETPTSICRRKENINLNKMPDDKVGQAIYLFYEIVVENVVKNIVKGFNENKSKFKFESGVNIINGGGTSMPNGFIKMVSNEFKKYESEISFKIGDIKHVKDPLFAVSRGCLLAAEMHG